MNHAILSIALFAVLAVSAGGATSALDSLYNVFSKASGTRRIQAANELVLELNKYEPDDAISLFHENETPARLDALTFYYMGERYVKASRFSDAVNCGIKALEAAERPGGGDERLLSDIYSLLSVAHSYLGNYSEALTCQQRGYEIDKKRGSPEALSSDLNTLAGLYLMCRDPEQAKSYINEVLDIERGLGRDDALAVRLGMAADIYGETGDLDKAMEYAREAFLTDSLSGNPAKAAVRKSQIAEIHVRQGDLREAERLLAEAIPVLRESRSLHSLSVACNQMGGIALKKSAKDDAARWYGEALDLSRSTGNIHIESKAEYGLWLSKKDSDPAAASSCLESYAAHRDSMYKEELAQALEANRVRYGTAVLAEHVAVEKQRNKMTVSMSVAAGIFLVIWIAILLYIYSVKSRTAKTLSRMERMRTDFFTNVTHEFRTPLTVILGYSKELKEGTLPHDVPPAKAGEMIYAEGKDMLSLVTQLLEISKIRLSIGEPDWRRGNIVAFIQMVTDTQAISAARKGIRLTYMPDRTEVEMDFVPDYMRKIMNNLISNAIKFTPDGGTVDVRTSVYAGDITISVTDNGIGIPEEDIPVIFEDFYRGQNAGSHIGTGIGLSLVRQTVEAMNGKITVRSAVGRGSAFTIVMPLSHGSKPLPAAGDEPSGKAGTDRTEARRLLASNDGADPALPAGRPGIDNVPVVMIVEDNLSVMHFIGSALGTGYSLEYVSNGANALDKAREILPDIIITDIMMPQMDGLELCRRIRSESLTSHIPVIVVSARGADEDRVSGIKAGADAYLTKPFNDEELSAMVGRLLESRRQMRERFSNAMDAGKKPDVNLTSADMAFLDKLDKTVEKLMAECSVDVESIAGAFCVTRKQLTKKVFAITGENTIDYVARLRVRKACSLLDDPAQIPVAEVALRCGYEDNAYFSRFFRQMVGMTPSQYRKRPRRQQDF